MTHNNRQRSIEQAREIMHDSLVVFDTETTGLRTSAEIVEISIISVTGAVLLDTLLRPVHPIPEEATAFMVSRMRTWQRLPASRSCCPN